MECVQRHSGCALVLSVFIKKAACWKPQRNVVLNDVWNNYYKLVLYIVHSGIFVSLHHRLRRIEYHSSLLFNTVTALSVTDTAAGSKPKTKKITAKKT